MDKRDYKALFRGKRSGFDQRSGFGSWIVGLLTTQMQRGTHSPILSAITSVRYGECELQVATDTLCQFTGLYDRQENLIFEHDIVKFRDKYYEVVRECDGWWGSYWAETGFVLGEMTKDLGYVSNFIHFTETIPEEDDYLDVEVVGNTFDGLIVKEEEK